MLTFYFSQLIIEIKGPADKTLFRGSSKDLPEWLDSQEEFFDTQVDLDNKSPPEFVNSDLRAFCLTKGEVDVIKDFLIEKGLEIPTFDDLP
jgi:hypothetical protein